MPNSCGYIAGNFDDVANICCDVRVVLQNAIADLKSDLDGLKNWVGDPSGGPTVYSRLTDTFVNTQSISAQTTTIAADTGHIRSTTDADYAIDQNTNTTLVTVGNGVIDIDDHVDGIATTVGSIQPGQTDVIDAVQANGALSLIVGLANFAKYAGGTSTLELVQWLLSMWNSPPVQLLTLGTPQPINSPMDLTIPSGVYGYRITNTVPAYWGRRSNLPRIYEPAVAYGTFRGPWGDVGDASAISVDQFQLYPIPVGATRLQIDLLPGISATYEELRFLG